MTTDLATTDWEHDLKTQITHIANTEMVPGAYRGKPAAILACVLTGRELGLKPMESLRQIDVIDGKPSPSSELLLAMIRRAGHRVRLDESTDKIVTVTGIRGDNPDDTMTVSYSWDEAKAAGLTNKSNWSKYPRDMMFWRAVARLARWQFGDAISGLSHTADELGADVDPVPVADVVRSDTSQVVPPPAWIPSAEDRTATAKQEATAMISVLERAETHDDEPSVWRITADGFVTNGIPSTVHKIEYNTRMLYECMEREDLWPTGEFRRRLAECDGAEHYADLGRKKMKVAFLQEAIDRAADDLGGGDAVSPSVDPPPSEVDPFEGLVVEREVKNLATGDYVEVMGEPDDPGEAWDELKLMLTADPSNWPAPLADKKARDLFKMMRRVGLWPDGAWAAAWKKHKGEVDEVEFAVMAWEQARQKVAAS